MLYFGPRQDDDEKVDENINIYFTYESRGTLKSFTLFTVKTITKPNLAHSDKYEIKSEELVVTAHVHQTMKKLVIPHCYGH